MKRVKTIDDMKNEIVSIKMRVLANDIKQYLDIIQMWSNIKVQFTDRQNVAEAKAKIEIYITKIKLAIQEFEKYVKEI